MKIKDIASVVSESVPYPAESGFEKFVGLEHYDAGEPKITRYGSTDMLKTAMKHFLPGDVLVARRNVYLRRAGIVDFEGLTSGDSIVLRPQNDDIARYLPFILNSNAFWDFADANSDGTMSKRLSPKTLLDYEFDLPPIEEQRVLADKLWAAYRLKESYRRLLTATQEMVKSQFIEMFGGEPQDKMLNDVCDFISGKSIPKTKEDDFGNVAYIKVADFNLAGNEKYITTSSRYVSQDAAKYSVTIDVGSVIFAKNGAASMSNKKRLTKVPCCIDMNTLSVSPQNNYMLPEYLYAIFEAIDIAAFVRQGAIPSIDIQALKNLHIPVPPIKLQQQFVTIAEQADKSGYYYMN